MSVREDKRADLLADLQAAVPGSGVLYEEEDLRPYECDALSAYRQLPRAVVLPRTEAELRQVLEICWRHRVPVVARGAGTGLSGGALPHAEGVVVSLARFMRILEIDPKSRTARVQPGVRNLALSEAAAPFNLYYAPDPSSQIACSLGGNVAENSGGVHCLKYGLTVHNVLAVRALVLSEDGVDEVVFGGPGPDAPGLDLLAVITGSEGMLIVITEITVRLTPKAEVARVVMASFASVTVAADAVAEIIAAGIIPAGLEMMDKQAIAAVEPFARAGYDTGAAAILLCESDGTPEEVADEIERVIQVLGNAGASQVRVSQDEAERLRFWAGRKAAFPAVGRITPDYLCMDGTIPRKRLGEMLSAIEAMERKYRLRCANVFHAGDGNLHPLIMFDANDRDETARALAFGAEILELSVALGGTITGEHGVGIEKLAQMCVQFTPEELAAFGAVKAAFDPLGLLNPGKVVPTAARCREYRQTGGGQRHECCDHKKETTA
ncbi:MAG TPA: FAD-linked oxidase C-terminal domain-containing protein [Rhodocyclaceae bacterium]|nr:FAD-linked oxidase C-terminal domain-containing protein [Rhodocyclaceae bacterium]